MSPSLTLTGPVLLLAQAGPSPSLSSLLPSPSGDLDLVGIARELEGEPLPLSSAYPMEQWGRLSQQLASLSAPEDSEAASRICFHQVGLFRQRLIWHGFVKKHRVAEEVPAELPLEGPWQHTLKSGRSFRDVLMATLERAGISPGELTSQMMGDKALLKKLLPFIQKRGRRFDLTDVTNFLLGNMVLAHPLPYPLIQWLVEKSGEDVRELSAASNDHFFASRISPVYLSTPKYPIYIQDQVDLKVIAAYRSNAVAHKAIGSLGWLIWTAMKHPSCYYTVEHLARLLDIAEARLIAIIVNDQKPGHPLLKEIASLFQHIPYRSFERAYNATHYHEMDRELREKDLFHGQRILLGSHRNEQVKLQRYIEQPGLPAQFLYGARLLLPDLPGVTVLSKDLKVKGPHLTRMELGDRSVQVLNIPEWRRVYAGYNLPEELLRIGAAIHFNIPEDDPVWRTTKSPEPKKPGGRLSDSITGSMRRAKQRKKTLAAESDDDPYASKVKIKLRQPEDGTKHRIYESEYPGKLTRQSVEDGEFLAELDKIEEHRDTAHPATLEIRLDRPQPMSESKLEIMREQSIQYVAGKRNIQQIIVVWPLYVNKQDPTKQAVLYPKPDTQHS